MDPPNVTSMSSCAFSTCDVPARDQFAAWCGWFDPVFDVVSPADGVAAGFVAEARVWSLGPAALSRVRAPGIHVVRRRENLRRHPVDHWNIVLGQVDTRLVRAGEALVVPAQTPFLFSLGETIESEREADERLQLYLPRDHFADLAPLLDQARGMPLVGPKGRLLSEYLALLGRSVPGLAAEDLARLPAAIQAMLQACLAPSADCLEAARAQTDLTRLEQVRLAIRRGMHRATLNTTTLCREVGMSRSNLYRLLEGEGGVVRYIQRLRLRATHAALCDTSDLRPIAAIAEATGFFDPSAFSRAFRREFGVAPSDLRMASRSGAALPPMPSPEMAADEKTLGAYLRGR